MKDVVLGNHLKVSYFLLGLNVVVRADEIQEQVQNKHGFHKGIKEINECKFLSLRRGVFEPESHHEHRCHAGISHKEEHNHVEEGFSSTIRVDNDLVFPGDFSQGKFIFAVI